MTSNNSYIVWFDLETTGLDLKKDRIIQIGLIKTTHDMNVIDAVEQKVNPCGVKSRPEALAKHNIKDEELLNFPAFSDIADKVLEFMEDCDLGGYNCINFDIPLLMEEMNRCGRYFSIEKRRIYDVKLLDSHYDPRTLENVYKKYFPKDVSECNAHDAICDTQMCIDIYKSMLERYKPSKTELDEINHNKTRIDLAGFFVFNEDMQVCMGKGKYSGKRVEEVDPSYFSWIMNNDFPKETINLACRCLAYVSRQNH